MSASQGPSDYRSFVVGVLLGSVTVLPQVLSVCHATSFLAVLPFSLLLGACIAIMPSPDDTLAERGSSTPIWRLVAGGLAFALLLDDLRVRLDTSRLALPTFAVLIGSGCLGVFVGRFLPQRKA